MVGDFSAGLRFLFSFNPQDFNWQSILVALGHAFFTLSLGMGAIMAYGAYMPGGEVSIGRTVVTVAILDTMVALIAGLVIFPIVFANAAIEPGEGPGLLFVSLPVAFGSMDFGVLFATVFFVLIALAALSSAISLIEPTVAWVVETKGYPRVIVVLMLGLVIWLLGLGTVWSFNDWKEFTWFGLTFFDTLEFLTANIMLPLGGLLMAIFVGWRMRRTAIVDEVGAIHSGPHKWWLRVLRFVSPVLVIIVAVMSLIDKFSS